VKLLALLTSSQTWMRTVMGPAVDVEFDVVESVWSTGDGRKFR
jgi:hypothetical protein